MSREKLVLNGIYLDENQAPKPEFHDQAEQEPKLSRTQAPADLSPADWQRGLRRQFGREQAFGLENMGSEPFFSEFRVSNPVSKSSYRVAIRGRGPGGNFCSCPDYSTSELGTCKHIEFTLARLEKKRGAKTAFARGYQPAFSELYLRNDGKRCVHFRAGTDCPPAMRKVAAGLFDAQRDGMLPDDRFGDLESFMATALKSGHEFRAYDDALDFIAGRRDADHRASRLEQLFPRGAADPQLLALLKVPLYPYQAEGALFAVRAGRALIGDDMGLGKTIQAIAASEILARHFGVSKVLVICPTSLKYQWQSEITRFSGRQDENAHKIFAHRRMELLSSLPVDIEQDVAPFPERVLHRRLGRAVAKAEDRRPFDELILGDQRVEARVVDEMIVDVVDLARPLRPRRCGHRHCHLLIRLQQHPRDRGFAGSGRGGEDDQEAAPLADRLVG